MLTIRRSRFIVIRFSTDANDGNGKNAWGLRKFIEENLTNPIVVALTWTVKYYKAVIVQKYRVRRVKADNFIPKKGINYGQKEQEFDANGTLSINILYYIL